jgi:hypothetical protein
MDEGNKTALPVIAGILDIFIGILTLGMVGIFAIAPMIFSDEGIYAAFLVLVAPGMIVGASAIAAGVLALIRKAWGWAMAGSVVASINPLPLGIVAVVLLALSKKEFVELHKQPVGL